MDILGDGPDDIKLSINKDYAERYTKFKDKQLLSKEEELLNSESSSTDDENAVLLNDKVQGKILVTLDKIKRKDPSIYDPNHIFFEDEDFSENDNINDKSKDAKITYTRFLREKLLENGPESFVKDEEINENKDKSKDATTNDAEEAKRAFLKSFNESNDFNDNKDDILIIKEKDKDKIAEDENNFKNFLNKRKRTIGGEDGDIISRFWGSETLSKDDEFLRDYILNERWREDSYINKSPIIDEKDEELETAELFEYAYNYRYQEPQGSEILTYGRDILDTVRRVDERRKLKRERLKLRKLEEKKMRIQELNRIKEINIKNANEKLKLLSKVTGIPLNQLDVNLDSPFNPESHEIEMNKMLGSDYHKQSEELSGKVLLSEKIQEIDQEIVENTDDNDADTHLWWMCDYCGGGILQGHKRFDCEVCNNYTLCKTCVPLANHKHKLIRKKVPKGHQPPSEYIGSNKIEKSLEGLMNSEDNHEIDYEDIIGGDLAVKFRYRNVKPESFGLNTDQILSYEDKELKKKCPIKKLLKYSN